MSIHIRVILDTRRKVKRQSEESGEDHFPVKLRITYNRVRRYYQTSLPPITKEDWKKVEKGLRMTATQREVFHGIREIEGRSKALIEEINPFSFPLFKSRFFGKTVSTSVDLMDMFRTHIAKLENEDRISTASSYLCALNSLLSYRKSFNWNDLHPEFFEGYERYMLENGRKQNTIGIYLRSLRTIINQGKAKGLIDQSLYPFGKSSQGKYQIPASVNVKKALTSEEIQKLKDASPSPGSRAARARDFWLFSYYINGCNIKDLVHLTWEEVDLKEEMVRFVRKKTARANKGRQVKISAVLSPIAKEVIEKYGIPSKNSSDFVFPIIEKKDSAKERHRKQYEFTKGINIGLQQLAADLEIDKKITTYTARHSHATALINNGASLEFVMDQFKHGSMRTTMNYVDSIDDSKRKEMAKGL